MRDRVKKYECIECGVISNVEKECDNYENEILRCSCCGRIVED